MEVNVAAVTVNTAAPLIVPEVAVVVALPCVRLVARPLLAMVATAVFDDVQLAVAVRFCVVPLL